MLLRDFMVLIMLPVMSNGFVGESIGARGGMLTHRLVQLMLTHRLVLLMMMLTHRLTHRLVLLKMMLTHRLVLLMIAKLMIAK